MREFTNELRTDNGDYMGIMSELFEVTHNVTDTLSTREIDAVLKKNQVTLTTFKIKQLVTDLGAEYNKNIKDQKGKTSGFRGIKNKNECVL
jgi:hypothetical protein